MSSYSVERLTKSSQDNIKNAEFQIRKKIQQQISTLAIKVRCSAYNDQLVFIVFSFILYFD